MKKSKKIIISEVQLHKIIASLINEHRRRIPIINKPSMTDEEITQLKNAMGYYEAKNTNELLQKIRQIDYKTIDTPKGFKESEILYILRKYFDLELVSNPKVLKIKDREENFDDEKSSFRQNLGFDFRDVQPLHPGGQRSMSDYKNRRKTRTE